MPAVPRAAYIASGCSLLFFFCVNTLPLPELLYVISEEFSLNVTLLEPASLSSYFVNNLFQINRYNQTPFESNLSQTVLILVKAYNYTVIIISGLPLGVER